MKYIKFIALLFDDDNQETGFLTAAHHLFDEGILEQNTHDELGLKLDWIEKNLPKRPNFPQDQDILISPMSWLKQSAAEHISMMQSIQEVLEENDILVEVLEVEHPGKIIYEDEWQIVAIPFTEQ